MGKIQKKGLVQEIFWYVHDQKVETGHVQRYQSIPILLQHHYFKLQQQHSRLSVLNQCLKQITLSFLNPSHPCYPNLHPLQLILQNICLISFSFPVQYSFVSLRSSRVEWQAQRAFRLAEWRTQNKDKPEGQE